MTIIADTKNWWAQAEGLNTLLIMDQYFPNDAHRYFNKFKQLWSYVQTYLIDPVNGDWYQGGLDKQPRYKTALKGQIWKGTYHNFRALLNCVQALEPEKASPGAPANVRLQRTDKSLILVWNASSGKTFKGYNIYKDGKRIWYTPLTVFTIPDSLKGKNLKVRAIDIHGNESMFSWSIKV